MSKYIVKPSFDENTQQDTKPPFKLLNGYKTKNKYKTSTLLCEFPKSQTLRTHLLFYDFSIQKFPLSVQCNFPANRNRRTSMSAVKKLKVCQFASGDRRRRLPSSDSLITAIPEEYYKLSEVFIMELDECTLRRKWHYFKSGILFFKSL